MGAGSLRRRPRRAALWLALAAWPLTAGGAAADLSGAWRIEIVDGPSKGDHGVIEVTLISDADASPRLYVGAMRFTDIRYNITAEERCELREAGAAVTVRCETDEPGWLPDDFDLKIVGPGEMRGPHISAVSGEALFYRAPADQPVS